MVAGGAARGRAAWATPPRRRPCFESIVKHPSVLDIPLAGARPRCRSAARLAERGTVDGAGERLLPDSQERRGEDEAGEHDEQEAEDLGQGEEGHPAGHRHRRTKRDQHPPPRLKHRQHGPGIPPQEDEEETADGAGAYQQPPDRLALGREHRCAEHEGAYSERDHRASNAAGPAWTE
jgi:hypothetical protein